MAAVKVEKIKVGDTIGIPGDRKVRTQWGRVDKIETVPAERGMVGLVILCSREWATESNKKYGDGFGCYTARKGESVKLKATK